MNSVVGEKKRALKEEIKIYSDYMKAIEKAYVEDSESKESIIKDIIFRYVQNIRFGTNDAGFAFIFKRDGTCVMHPTEPSYNNQNIINIADANGVKYIEKYIETSTTHDFVEYSVRGETDI